MAIAYIHTWLHSENPPHWCTRNKNREIKLSLLLWIDLTPLAQSCKGVGSYSLMISRKCNDRIYVLRLYLSLCLWTLSSITFGFSALFYLVLECLGTGLKFYRVLSLLSIFLRIFICCIIPVVFAPRLSLEISSRIRFFSAASLFSCSCSVQCTSKQNISEQHTNHFWIYLGRLLHLACLPFIIA